MSDLRKNLPSLWENILLEPSKPNLLQPYVQKKAERANKIKNYKGKKVRILRQGIRHAQAAAGLLQSPMQREYASGTEETLPGKCSDMCALRKGIYHSHSNKKILLFFMQKKSSPQDAVEKTGAWQNDDLPHLR